MGDRLNLVREPHNEYDNLAILVNDPKGRKLGYVPRRGNAAPARLMDAGKLLYAIIDDIDMGPKNDDIGESYPPPWHLLKIAIYMED